MIKFITHIFKRKSKPSTIAELTAEIIEQKAIERIVYKAQKIAKEEICSGCQDLRCLKGQYCEELDLRSKAYAFEIMMRSAELN